MFLQKLRPVRDLFPLTVHLRILCKRECIRGCWVDIEGGSNLEEIGHALVENRRWETMRVLTRTIALEMRTWHGELIDYDSNADI